MKAALLPLALVAAPAWGQAAPVAPAPVEQAAPPPLPTPRRAGENAVRQAEDAFGFSVARESLGLYSSANVRGFSPFATGTVRIEGLYFGPFLTLIQRLRQLASIRFGLSATRDNRVSIPARTRVDLGARFRLSERDAMLRLQRCP